MSPQWWFSARQRTTSIANEMFKQRATGLADSDNHALNLAGS